MGDDNAFDLYQKEALKYAIYPHRGDGSWTAVAYCALGLSGESGEIAEKVKKSSRDNGFVIDDGIRQRIGRELGDVMWYVAAMASELGFTLSEIAAAGIEKIADRRLRGTLQGSGDDR